MKGRLIHFTPLVIELNKIITKNVFDGATYGCSSQCVLACHNDLDLGSTWLQPSVNDGSMTTH